jgi:Uncharacterized protein conserved in bacteria (DUF2252)
MNIHQATTDYERWMRTHTQVIESDLRSKHQKMRSDLFLFFRGTFYRWAQRWPEVCADLNHAPKVISVGDLHVNSFGTWRDAEGRMAWGVDDFDDAYPLPYTSDLVRLAASLKIVNDLGQLNTKPKIGCDIILESYEAALKAEGCPIVLAEHQTIMERLGFESIDPPEDFWEKLNRRPSANGRVPGDAKRVLKETLPHEVHNYKVVLRRAGLGSLGQQRFVAIAEWEGGCVAREAKEMVPSSCAWLNGPAGDRNPYYQRAIASARRAHDPYQKTIGRWIIRRLSPDSNPVEIACLPKKRDEEVLLHAMGTEAANVHLGSRHRVKDILKDLRRRKSHWLRTASKAMAKAIEQDWKNYKSG